MKNSDVIQLRDLTKVYPETVAVDQISFRVPHGEVVGFLGPNGAGKTTTLKILTCFMPATSGHAEVNGYDIYTQSMGVRRSIGYLPENNALYEEMGVREYLRFRSALKGVPWSQRRSRVARSLELCGLGNMARRSIGQLSKGYRQRVGLADTLVGDPPVLILDEPTVGLDPRQIVEVRELIKRLAKEKTILLSTHYLPEVEQICDRVVIIHQGRIALDDSLERVCRGPLGEERRLEEVFIEVTGEDPSVVGVEATGARRPAPKQAKADEKDQKSPDPDKKADGAA
jgi:ABC-2 type transport system ATP-binding protein